MTADDLYKIILYAVKKNQNGSVTPTDFNRIINVGMRSWISWMLGSFQTYQPGRPIARVELGQNSVVRQRLTPAIYGYILNINPIYGTSPYPGDYLQTDTMYSIYGIRKIRYVENDQLDAAYNSVIDPIATSPIYLLQDVNFQFYPTNTWQAKLRYVKNPESIVWAYTLDGNNRPVYDPINSVDPIFDDLTMLEIAVRALALVGLNLQLNTVIGYSQEIKNQGQ